MYNKDLVLNYLQELICRKIQYTNQKTSTVIFLAPYIYGYLYKLADRCRGQPEGPFSKVTVPRCREGCYSFTWITLLTLYPYLIILTIKVGV